MVPNYHVTHTGQLTSTPHSTCGFDINFEPTKSLSQCLVSERLLEDYQRIVRVNRQLFVVLCISLMLLTAAIAALAILCRIKRSQVSSGTRLAYVSSRIAPHKTTVVAAPLENLAQPLSPAPMDANIANASKRGKSSIIREITSGSISSSNTAREQAQSAFTHAVADPFSVTQASQFDGIKDDITRVDGTAQKALGPRRGSSNPLLQSSPPAVDGAQFSFFQPGFYRPLDLASLFGQFTATFIRYWQIPRLGNHPLLHSLYGQGPTFSIFAVAGDDAERDLQALHRALMRPYSATVRFVSLSQFTTLDNIEAEIKKLYGECQNIPDAHLFIYLTGHGDWHNRMVLSESKAIGETHLFELLSGPTIPVTILIDICRKGRLPSAIPPKGISLVWTCSLGETAGACRITNCDSPNSCFLIALMISARTPKLQHTNEGLKQMVQNRLDQLMAYLKEAYVIRHSKGDCVKCSVIKPCDKPTRQNVDWGDAENIDGLMELTKILSSSEIAEEVYQRFMGDRIFLRVNNLLSPRRLHSGLEDGGGKLGLLPIVAATPSLAPTFDPLPEDHTYKHERGANEPVHAG
ncbi:putative transmembrane protein [Rhizoctonia solani 123E]|uniref:Putative transmembrane protein n=1 Tax=Rhizoctonia solani 123E TaxID=1423351 RepID=A0A074RK81_9AGAM|nr:putative transmembrane protein [Rhizoctonia solani 123E]